jgi:hypothetical protein
MTYTLHHADILEWGNAYDGPLFHAAFCDAPYEMREIDLAEVLAVLDGQANPAGAKGFMGKSWDGNGISFWVQTWQAIAHCLHPGAFLFVFAGTINDDLISVAMRQAGLRKHHKMLSWSYGSGLQKSTRMDDKLDRRAGATREVVRTRKHAPKFAAADFGYREKDNGYNSRERQTFDETAPATDMAQTWAGHRYGLQHLKPSAEPVLVYRKPFNENPFCAIISQITFLMEGWICTLLPAHDAETLINRLHRNLRAGVDSSAQQNAGDWACLETVNIAGDPSVSSLANSTLRSFVAGPAPTPGAMLQLVSSILNGVPDLTFPKDTDTYDVMVGTLQSIVWSWSAILAALCDPTNTYTTETETSLITDLTTLQLSVSQSIPASITRRSEPTGLLLNVQTVGAHLTSVLVRLQSLIAITASESATEPPASQESAPAESPRESGLTRALESILVFQKPYAGDALNSITATGAGAVNIEGGRIGTDRTIATHRADMGYSGGLLAAGDGYTTGSECGRWPANLALSHHPACNGACHPDCTVRRLGEQSGERASGGSLHEHSTARQNIYGQYTAGRNTYREPDAGTAARFFYNADWLYERLEAADQIGYFAKPAQAEKEAGLDPMQIALLELLTGETHGEFNGAAVGDGRKTPIDNAFQRGTKVRRNTHTTLKSISLCRWLATLLLPPDAYAPRRLLVPFAGVGSEMIGALLAGWDEVEGVELVAEHVRIGRARLAYWQARRHEFLDGRPVTVDAAPAAPDGQLTLFDAV